MIISTTIFNIHFQLQNGLKFQKKRTINCVYQLSNRLEKRCQLSSNCLLLTLDKIELGEENTARYNYAKTSISFNEQVPTTLCPRLLIARYTKTAHRGAPVHVLSRVSHFPEAKRVENYCSSAADRRTTRLGPHGGRTRSNLLDKSALIST